MKYIVTINDKSYEVEVERGQASIVRTTQAVAVPVQTVAPAPAASVETAKPSGGTPAQADTISGEPLKAPMPGTIVAVHVHTGAEVKRGAVLFVLEAMKMENEITAVRDGVVAQIMVAKGASVSTGDILLTLK